ncbi:MAG: alpha/beta fold hydrolase [Proteobacteria bacterium]|nr:alpha/beta fold hydrolase [Pseudomonadota bacterium]
MSNKPPFQLAGDHGPVLALVHGFPLDATLWAEQRALAGHVRLLTFDLPGFGAQPAGPLPTDLGGYAEHVRAVLDAAGAERVILGGLSMGGYIAFECWRRFPQRIDGLLLCDTRAEADSVETRAVRERGIAAVHEGRRAELLENMIETLLSAASRARGRPAAATRAMMHRASDAGIIAALGALRDRADSTPTLATITVPTLIVCGEQDALTPPALARAMHAGIARSQLALIASAGHLAPLEQALAFDAAVARWLAAERLAD